MAGAGSAWLPWLVAAGVLCSLVWAVDLNGPAAHTRRRKETGQAGVGHKARFGKKLEIIRVRAAGRRIREIGRAHV